MPRMGIITANHQREIFYIITQRQKSSNAMISSKLSNASKKFQAPQTRSTYVNRSLPNSQYQKAPDRLRISRDSIEAL